MCFISSKDFRFSQSNFKVGKINSLAKPKMHRRKPVCLFLDTHPPNPSKLCQILDIFPDEIGVEITINIVPIIELNLLMTLIKSSDCV